MQQLFLLWWWTGWWRLALFQEDTCPYTYSTWQETLWKRICLTVKPTFIPWPPDRDLRGMMNWREGWNWEPATCNVPNVLHVVTKIGPVRINWGCPAPRLPPQPLYGPPEARLEEGASQQGAKGHFPSPFVDMHTGQNGLSQGHFRHLPAVEVLPNIFTYLRKLSIFPLHLFSSHPGEPHFSPRKGAVASLVAWKLFGERTMERQDLLFAIFHQPQPLNHTLY